MKTLPNSPNASCTWVPMKWRFKNLIPSINCKSRPSTLSFQKKTFQVSSDVPPTPTRVAPICNYPSSMVWQRWNPAVECSIGLSNKWDAHWRDGWASTTRMMVSPCRSTKCQLNQVIRPVSRLKRLDITVWRSSRLTVRMLPSSCPLSLIPPRYLDSPPVSNTPLVCTRVPSVTLSLDHSTEMLKHPPPLLPLRVSLSRPARTLPSPPFTERPNTSRRSPRLPNSSPKLVTCNPNSNAPALSSTNSRQLSKRIRPIHCSMASLRKCFWTIHSVVACPPFSVTSMVIPTTTKTIPLKSFTPFLVSTVIWNAITMPFPSNRPTFHRDLVTTVILPRIDVTMSPFYPSWGPTM
mmetsp:Transcript_19121/g.31684  ORF Transcript_19121/g.31684 Transcript_19121/m.31684 type:complete len:350 (-) Transcript_19121:2207-3256(-)